MVQSLVALAQSHELAAVVGAPAPQPRPRRHVAQHDGGHVYLPARSTAGARAMELVALLRLRRAVGPGVQAGTSRGI